MDSHAITRAGAHLATFMVFGLIGLGLDGKGPLKSTRTLFEIDSLFRLQEMPSKQKLEIVNSLSLSVLSFFFLGALWNKVLS